MINLLWSGFIVMLVLSGCGWNGTPSRENDFIPLTSVEISADSPAIAASRTIAPHTSTTLSAEGNASGLLTRDVTAQAVWTSSSPAVAGFITAASPNRVTGLAPGTAILTATVGGVSASYTLTVSSATVAAVTITPAAPTIFKGLTAQLTASGSFSDGSTQDLTFDAGWASSDPGVATVSNASASKGLTKAVAVGQTTIGATFTGKTGSTLLTVTAPVLQSITVTPANPSILTLSTGSFKATGNYSDGSTPDITAQATWSSSNSAVATVNSSGAVTTLLQGTTTISATLNGVPGTSNLRVTGGNLNAIVISPLAPKLVKDTTGRLTATGTFSNGSSRDISGVVDWTVAATTAETTKAGGNLVLLKALAATPASTITAKSGTVTATAVMTVVDPPLISIVLATTNLDLTAGTSSPLTANAHFNDGTVQDVTAIASWTSNAASIATVGTSGHAAGRVTGVASGATIISAAYGGKTVTTPATVVVTPRHLQSLTISGPSNVTAGSQVVFTALATYSDGSKDVTEDATWTLDNQNVAILADSLNQPGQVVGVDTGSATLTAGFGGITKTATITVQ